MWATGLPRAAPHREARWVWWHPVVPALFRSKRLQTMYPWTWYGNLDVVILHLNRTPNFPIKVGNSINNGSHQLLWAMRILAPPRGLSQLSSLLYLVFFSCLLSEAVLPVLGHSSGVIATYIHVYFISLIGESKFSVHLYYGHLWSP